MDIPVNYNNRRKRILFSTLNFGGLFLGWTGFCNCSIFKSKVDLRCSCISWSDYQKVPSTRCISYKGITSEYRKIFSIDNSFWDLWKKVNPSTMWIELWSSNKFSENFIKYSTNNKMYINGDYLIKTLPNSCFCVSFMVLFLKIVIKNLWLLYFCKDQKW